MSNLYLFPQDAIKLEGDSDTTPFTFQVARIGETMNELTVDYSVTSPVLTAVVDGELPVDESDFGGTFPTGTVTFAPGEALQTITVDVAGDEVPEIEQAGAQNADLFEVALSNPSDTEATIATESATGIILNDDAYFGPQNTISDTAVGASSLTTADLDGDGDNDALTTSSDGSITWYDNVNGDGTSWTPNVITTDALNAEIVFAADVDGDGDSDVLSASTTSGEVSWYENQDGVGTFSEASTILNGFTGVNSIVSADVDGDTDVDLLLAGNDTLSWYENLSITPDVVEPDPGTPVPGQPGGEPTDPGTPVPGTPVPGQPGGEPTDGGGTPVPGTPVPGQPDDGLDPDLGGDGGGDIIGGDDGDIIGGDQAPGQPGIGDDIIGDPAPGQPSVGEVDDITNPDPNGNGTGDIIGDPGFGQTPVGMDGLDPMPVTPVDPMTDIDLGMGSSDGFGDGAGDNFSDPILGQPLAGFPGNLTSVADTGLQVVAQKRVAELTSCTLMSSDKNVS